MVSSPTFSGCWVLNFLNRLFYSFQISNNKNKTKNKKNIILYILALSESAKKNIRFQFKIFR